MCSSDLKQNLQHLLQQYLGINQQSQNEQSEEQQPQEGSEQGDPSQSSEAQDPAGAPGEGMDGSSNTSSSRQQGDIDFKGNQRRFVPKSTGSNPDNLPAEFSELIEAYNKTIKQ